MFNVTVQDLIHCSPTIEVQLSCLFFWTILWTIALPIFVFGIKKFIDSKPWKEKWLEHNLNAQKKTYKLTFDTRQEGYNFSVLFSAVLFQHITGGLLTIPALFPKIASLLNISPSMATSLCLHGALCEAGWEVSDTFTRLYQIFLTKDGYKKNPATLVFLSFLHHMMGLTITIPMNLSFFDLHWYHEAIFTLQWAAAIALFLQYYGYTLNLELSGDLIRMKISIFISFITIFWTRIFRYIYVAYFIISHISLHG